MFPVFETIALLNGQPQYLHWHQLRYARTYQSLYGHAPHHNLMDGIQIPTDYQQGFFRMKIQYNEHERSASFATYQPKPIRSLKLIEDDDLRYDCKYTDRSRLDALFTRRGDCDDILIVQNGLITDTSYCNIVLFDGQKWWTPAKPLLAGTCRARLLEQSMIHEADISLEELKQFNGFGLINALRGFELLEQTTIAAIGG